MKVTISVLGRFHAFDLARELERLGALDRLYTSYPGARATRFGIPKERVRGCAPMEVANRALQRVETLSSGRIDARALACEWHDRAVARRLRPESDVFLGWSGSALASLERAKRLGMLACVERGSTHIVHQRDLLAEEYARWGIRGRLPNERVVERELAEYDAADRIVVPTAFVARTFLAKGVSPERLIQVPYGVSLGDFGPPPDGRAGQREFTLMHCGNVSLRKGCLYLMQAFRELDLPNARLLFVGPVSDEVRPHLARLGGPNVHFTGRVPQSELARHYANASAFCLASLEEGMAMVIAQAMSCGLPVIATRESGAEELVRDGNEGWLVRARDVDDLKRAILEAYESENERLAMGERAHRRVASGFAWEDYGRQIHAAYGRALGDEPRRMDEACMKRAIA